VLDGLDEVMGYMAGLWQGWWSEGSGAQVQEEADDGEPSGAKMGAGMAAA